MFTRIVLVLFLVTFLLFVWPTRYKNYAPSDSPYIEELGRVPTRVDRLSGDIYVKREDMWHKTSLNENDFAE